LGNNWDLEDEEEITEVWDLTDGPTEDSADDESLSSRDELEI